MLSQTHSFKTEEEVLRFQQHVLRFITRLDKNKADNGECLFLTNNRTVRRQLVTVQATSSGTLKAFNQYLETDTARRDWSIVDAV